MGLFKKKKDGYVDLGEKLRKQEEKIKSFRNNNSIGESSEISESIHEPTPEPENQSGFMGFFGSSTPAVEEPIESQPEERRKKLKSILNGLSDRLDEQDKEIYRLKQKLEVIERKQNVGYR